MVGELLQKAVRLNQVQNLKAHRLSKKLDFDMAETSPLRRGAGER